MKSTSPNIILIGFKHVGKTVIGRALASQLDRNFIDLDHFIESIYEKKFQRKLKSREIFLMHGQKAFEGYEHNAILQLPAENTVISLGGGTLRQEDNRLALAKYTLVHINCDKSLVFQRIMSSGWPASFPKGTDHAAAFEKLWDEREKIYLEMAKFSIMNDGTIDEAVKKIRQKLQE